MICRASIQTSCGHPTVGLDAVVDLAGVALDVVVLRGAGGGGGGRRRSVRRRLRRLVRFLPRLRRRGGFGVAGIFGFGPHIITSSFSSTNFRTAASDSAMVSPDFLRFFTSVCKYVFIRVAAFLVNIGRISRLMTAYRLSFILCFVHRSKIDL